MWASPQLYFSFYNRHFISQYEIRNWIRFYPTNALLVDPSFYGIITVKKVNDKWLLQKKDGLKTKWSPRVESRGQNNTCAQSIMIFCIYAQTIVVFKCILSKSIQSFQEMNLEVDQNGANINSLICDSGFHISLICQ